MYYTRSTCSIVLLWSTATLTDCGLWYNKWLEGILNPGYCNYWSWVLTCAPTKPYPSGGSCLPSRPLDRPFGGLSLPTPGGGSSCLATCTPTAFRAGAADTFRASVRFQDVGEKAEKENLPFSASMATSNTREVTTRDVDRNANIIICWART